MRHVIYTAYMHKIPMFETFSYSEAEKAKTEGYSIKTRLVERRKPRTKSEKEYMRKRFQRLGYSQ